MQVSVVEHPRVIGVHLTAEVKDRRVFVLTTELRPCFLPFIQNYDWYSLIPEGSHPWLYTIAHPLEFAREYCALLAGDEDAQSVTKVAFCEAWGLSL